MTHLRSIVVSIEVDTNKSTTNCVLSPGEDESVEEFAERVSAWIVECVEGATE